MIALSIGAEGRGGVIQSAHTEYGSAPLCVQNSLLGETNVENLLLAPNACRPYAPQKGGTWLVEGGELAIVSVLNSRSLDKNSYLETI